MSESRWRWIWWAAALHNAVGVAIFGLGHDAVYTWQGLLPPNPPFHYDTWIAIVAVFGVAYAVVARDPRGRYAPGIALAGILCKLASVGGQIAAFARWPDQIPMSFALPIFSDLIWVLVFGWFLRSFR